jgi:rubrerythrin
MDRYWQDDGRPFLLQNEQVLITAPGVTPRVLSGLNVKLKELKAGTLYITNMRLIFVCEMNKKAKDPRMKFDGFTLFYSDVNKASIVGKGSLKVECVLEKGTLKSKKANIYFKESLKSRGEMLVVDETVQGEGKKKKEEKSKKVQPQAPSCSKDVESLLSEINEEAIELTCPACGSLITYQPGMTTCPACKRNVKFIAD